MAVPAAVIQGLALPTRWYCVQCKPRQESRAEEHLANQGYQVYLPRIRSRQRIRGASRLRIHPMFPGYLFISLAAYRDEWAPIRSTRGVIGLVRVGGIAPQVPEEVIDALQGREDDQGHINLAIQTDYKPDDPVEITDGPFAGIRALFRTRNSEERVIVLLKLLSQEREIEVPAEYLRKF